ncbi:hypothetical protein AM500_24285 [Bacillus sp. FJAT-18017]|uniref:hypothetical protein n=1 Tax=Bacillus sp. FJAT-18017 TaxID=1705566 RepID=UPI0006ADB6C1|nr:hypothetical protein [Bacillus sp. FJAT-18017]ALC92531.1 hypothetical protein AM500_24285 [Bacillus sp. FJAT-18017]
MAKGTKKISMILFIALLTVFWLLVKIKQLLDVLDLDKPDKCALNVIPGVGNDHHRREISLSADCQGSSFHFLLK